jgi:hypothetical protein
MTIFISAIGKMKSRIILPFLILQSSIFNLQFSFAQEFFFPLNRDINTRIEPFYEADTSGFHSAAKPFTMAELKESAPVDSVFAPQVRGTNFNKTWLGRKLFKEHFIDADKDEIHLSIDPVFNFQGGKDLTAKENAYVNSRGVLIKGEVKQKFFFYTGFRENRAHYVGYIADFVNSTSVAPGQGRVKFLGEHIYDFSFATGGVAYTLNRHFDFLLATDKNFIGDGYRSLLLSDNSNSYPFFRINMKFWKFKYTVIYSVMQDSITNADTESGFRKKIGRFSYLDLNIGKRNRVSIGLFEALISKRSFDFNYANPVLFLRPVEYSVGSPDNELIGANVKYKINPRNLLYGQLLLDEFLLSEVRSGNGWWANKQAFQLGGKSFDVLGIKNLNVQTEFNFVRPYTYSHLSSQTNYSQYNQALAHPLGANFYESVSFINYRWKNFFAEAKYVYSQIGLDYLNSNLGSNIFLDYNTHDHDYGNKLLQGILTTLSYKELRISYLVNPKTNFIVEAGISDRNYKNIYGNFETRFVYFGIRTALENTYFDF